MKAEACTDSLFDQAWRALQKAGERIGQAGYQAQLAAHLKKGRKQSTFRYEPTEAHLEVIKALSDMGYSRITPEQAMTVLHQYEVLKERTI